MNNHCLHNAVKLGVFWAVNMGVMVWALNYKTAAQYKYGVLEKEVKAISTFPWALTDANLERLEASFNIAQVKRGAYEKAMTAWEAQPMDKESLLFTFEQDVRKWNAQAKSLGIEVNAKFEKDFKRILKSAGKEHLKRLSQCRQVYTVAMKTLLLSKPLSIKKIQYDKAKLTLQFVGDTAVLKTWAMALADEAEPFWLERLSFRPVETAPVKGDVMEPQKCVVTVTLKWEETP